MAGAGYKLFATGDVLSASDVNLYLQQQTVMVFASAAARTTALASVLAEGMVTYLKDTDVVEIYTGAAWVSLDDPNAIQNSIVTAKGSIVAASAASTPAALAVGNNGETLVADSSTSSGLRYQTGYNNNAIINGGFDVWQRGTSTNITSTYAYSADRWQTSASGASGTIGTLTRQTVSDTTNLPTIQYCARVQRTAASTATQSPVMNLSLESSDSYRFAGQTVTVSYYARAGANYSSASSGLAYYLFSGTGTDQNIGTAGFTGQATTASGTATLTTTWQRFTYTATVAATATQLALWFQFTPTGTAGAADYFEITGVQLELGSVATRFKRSSGGTIQGELAACQRYFYRFGGLIANEYFAIGTSVSAGTAIGYASPKVSLRGTPTLSFTTASNYRVIEGTSQTTATSVNAEELSANNISFAFNASGFTIGRANRMNANNTTNGYIDISAEL
jgi:hypothetical protein